MALPTPPSEVVAVALAALALVPGPAAAQSPNLVSGKSHWSAARYTQAIPPLKLHRREPNGRTAEVDYMLGTSGCRIPAQRAWGAKVLNFALYTYPLTAASRATITAQRDKCVGLSAMAPLSSEQRLAVSTAVIAGATARGKLFDFGERGIASYPARRTRTLAAAEKSGRLIPVAMAAEAKAALAARARRLPALAGGRVHVHGQFAILTKAGQSDAELTRMSDQLGRYVAFLRSEYGVAIPDRYITLYLLPDIRTVRAAADQLHGLDVSPSTLGYSFQDDLSAVGMIRGTQSGTMMHELFHLLVRGSFGDIPQWLDEGLASLYEVSAERGTGYVGLPNWRGRVLSNAWDQRPSLATVISSPWFAFDRTDAQSGGFMIPDERIAVHLATARYFALYLQEKRVLKDVFAAFRDRDPGAADDPASAAVAIVEQRIGPVAASQADYDRWLRRLTRDNSTNRRDTSGKTLQATRPPGGRARVWR